MLMNGGFYRFCKLAALAVVWVVAAGCESSRVEREELPDGGEGDAGDDVDGGGVDCDGLAQLPLEDHVTSATIGTEDFAFDAFGNMIVVSEGALFRVNRDGESELVAVGLGSWIRGTRVLPGGDYVVANCETGSLERVWTTGGHEVIVTGLGLPNGIAVDPEGLLYVTSSEGNLYRVNPETQSAQVVAQMSGFLDGITFSPDYKTLYVNTEDLRIYEIAIDDDGTVGTPVEFVFLEEASDILDGMAADECGNLYVVDMMEYVWLITPDGHPQKIVEQMESICATAVNFGSGVGGWERDHIYVQSMDGILYEMDMGVVGKDEPHLP